MEGWEKHFGELATESSNPLFDDKLTEISLSKSC